MFDKDYEEASSQDEDDNSEDAEINYQNKKWLKNEIDNLISRSVVEKAPEKNICILSYNMTISLVNCKFNLSTAKRDAICVLTNGGVIEIKSCDFKGNKESSCSGVVVLRSHMLMMDSGFEYFKNQGVLIWGEYNFRVMIYDCIIRNNENRGIAVIGEGFSP